MLWFVICFNVLFIILFSRDVTMHWEGNYSLSLKTIEFVVKVILLVKHHVLTNFTFTQDTPFNLWDQSYFRVCYIDECKTIPKTKTKKQLITWKRMIIQIHCKTIISSVLKQSWLLSFRLSIVVRIFVKETQMISNMIYWVIIW